MKLTVEEQISRLESIESNMNALEEALKGFESVECDKELDGDGLFSDTLTLVRLRFDTFRDIAENKIDELWPEGVEA
ncbi:hypothetical protein GCM10011506_34060 [Marivirga lumbricoides]|uniref:Uncharacterized protein n=1 Tax=Marivirga lumbricoides TaxID=1046115 RepID=A0ABQ1MV66_9BACT|nr:hypothetical protein GCM10011506_34060 [Marivirga lumbricoides]